MYSLGVSRQHEPKPAKSLKRIRMESRGRPKYINGYAFESNLKSNLRSQSDDVLNGLSNELSKLPILFETASADMLHHLIVETSSSDMPDRPLSHVAVVSMIDSKTLSVTPHNPQDLEAVEIAIVTSLMNLKPIPDGQNLIVPIPLLNKENIKALCKVIQKCSTDFISRLRKSYAGPSRSLKEIALKLPFEQEVRLKNEILDMFREFAYTGLDMCTVKKKDLYKKRKRMKKELAKNKKQMKKGVIPKVSHGISLCWKLMTGARWKA